MKVFLAPLIRRLHLAAFLCTVLFSCEREEEEAAPPGAEFLIRSEQMRSFNVGEINTALGQMLIDDFDKLINNPITTYRIDYRTTLFGEQIEASGLIVVPLFTDNAPIVSAQHLIITDEDNAPSDLLVLDGKLGFPELLSANGFITFIPDYIGFGASDDRLQPFFLQEPSVQVTIDMIRAGIEFLEQQSISFSQELFLYGYSQGGYVTLAVQDALENNPNTGLEAFDLQAVSAGAGGYALDFVVDTITAQAEYPAPAFLSLLFLAYQSYVPGLNQPLGNIFAAPFAGQIPAFFDGSNSFKAINKQLPVELDELFVPSFLESLRAPQPNAFQQAFAANSVVDFVPQAPLRLYHSEEDQVIPPSSTLFTADQFRNEGIASLEVIIFNGGGHFKAASKVTAGTLKWFSALK